MRVSRLTVPLTILVATAFAVGFLMPPPAGAAATASLRKESPDAARILAELKPGHPRLIVPQSRIEELRRQIKTDETLAKWYKAIRAEAEKTIQAEPSKYEIPDGKRLLATSRRVVDRVTTLGLLYRLDGDRRYVERAWKELAAAAAFKDWNPSHFLDTAEMTAAFGIGYDWFYDQWTAEQRRTLRQAIVTLGLNAGLKVYRSGGWWSKCEHNWNQVCNGGLTVGALAIADEEPALAGEILEQAIRSVPRAMQHFAPDGAWAEGPGYWGYATQYNVLMLAALGTALGTDYGLSQIAGFSEAGTFPLYASGPFGLTFSFADAHAGTVRAPQLFWFSRKFDRPEFAELEIAQARPHAMDLAWYDPRGHKADRQSLPLDKYFRQSEVGTFRRAWGDRNTLFVAFKAGSNAVNHSHLDLGTFVLDALGERWFVDIGSDDYNLPGYFGRQRWDYYRLRAEGHNTLVINPSPGPDQDPRAVTTIVQFAAPPGSRSPSAVLDLTAAYAAHATKVQRTIAMPDRRSVTLRDQIETKAPAEIWSFLHTPAKVELSHDGSSATLTLGKKSVRVELASPTGAKLAVLPAKPLSTSPTPDRQGENRRISKLAVHVQGVRQAAIELHLIPRWP